MSDCEWLQENSYTALYGANVILEEFNKKIPKDTDEVTAMSVLDRLCVTKEIIGDIEARLLSNFRHRGFEKLLPKSWRKADDMLKQAVDSAMILGNQTAVGAVPRIMGHPIPEEAAHGDK